MAGHLALMSRCKRAYPKGLKPGFCGGVERPKAEALGYLEAAIHHYLVGGDDEVEGDGLAELDASGGAGGDLILVGAGWGDADVGVAAAAAAGGPEGGQG